MHPDSKHLENYNLDKLCLSYKILEQYIFINKHGSKTIDFANADAVKALNTALLKKHYNINYWEFPENNLCPPIPSRADYLYYLNDLLKEGNYTQKPIRVLDIGTGATCIYPLLGNSLFNWEFVASDISEKSLENAQVIITKNKLDNKVELRKQSRKKYILEGVIKANETFFASMCNPPFYKTKEYAQKANNRKQRNLGLAKNSRNFSGKSNELWYKGGEVAFIKNYIKESVAYKNQVRWFTSLVSKKENLETLYKALQKAKAATVKTIVMKQGNKITRFIAWQF